jgi:hypothetical protein
MKHKLILILWLAFITLCDVQAAPAQLKTFTNGSYQQLVTQYKNHPWVLIIWSTTCPSCLKELSTINKLHQLHPKINFVMLTVDDALATHQINEVLEKNQLTHLDNWLFNEENSEKLRFEIDPNWYGELPRTYFFNAAHQRSAISGVLTPEKYNEQLIKISK